jgi:hypothetical protein
VAAENDPGARDGVEEVGMDVPGEGLTCSVAACPSHGIEVEAVVQTSSHDATPVQLVKDEVDDDNMKMEMGEEVGGTAGGEGMETAETLIAEDWEIEGKGYNEDELDYNFDDSIDHGQGGAQTAPVVRDC